MIPEPRNILCKNYMELTNRFSYSKRNSLSRAEVAKRARVRADVYSLLASLFNQRADAELVQRLRTAGADSFLTVTQGDDITSELREGLHEIAGFVQNTAEQPEDDVLEMMVIDWTRLFRGVSAGYGPPPPYEGLYTAGESDNLRVPRIVSHCYSENGADIGPESPNRPDYIGLELDFLRFLAELEAQAWEEGNEEQALRYLNTAKTFLSEHLGLWHGKFCDVAIKHAKTRFYRGVLLMTKGAISQLQQEEGTIENKGKACK